MRWWPSRSSDAPIKIVLWKFNKITSPWLFPGSYRIALSPSFPPPPASKKRAVFSCTILFAILTVHRLSQGRDHTEVTRPKQKEERLCCKLQGMRTAKCRNKQMNYTWKPAQKSKLWYSFTSTAGNVRQMETLLHQALEGTRTGYGSLTLKTYVL
jgi:hypothetical protein